MIDELKWLILTTIAVYKVVRELPRAYRNTLSGLRWMERKINADLHNKYVELKRRVHTIEAELGMKKECEDGVITKDR